MNNVPHLPRPSGVVIDVSIPRWLVSLARLSIAVGIIGILLLVLFGMVFFGWNKGSGDSVSESPSLAVTRANFDSRPVEYQVHVTAGTKEASSLDKEWTLLLSSGSIHWANVVEGPTKLAPGESATLTLTFLFDPQPQEGQPVALRWDPARKVTASVGLSR
jgi:hypothetical protein